MNRLLILPKMKYMAEKFDAGVWRLYHYSDTHNAQPWLPANYELYILLGLNITVVDDLGRKLHVKSVGMGTWGLTTKSHLISKIRVLRD